MSKAFIFLLHKITAKLLSVKNLKLAKLSYRYKASLTSIN